MPMRSMGAGRRSNPPFSEVRRFLPSRPRERARIIAAQDKHSTDNCEDNRTLRRAGSGAPAAGGQFAFDDLLEGSQRLRAFEAGAVDEEARGAGDASPGPVLEVGFDLILEFSAAQTGPELLLVEAEGACVLDKTILIQL